MTGDENRALQDRISRIRRLCTQSPGHADSYEAAALSQSVLYDTLGSSHPLMATIKTAVEKGSTSLAIGASRGVLALYDTGALTSPRLAIAREIESEILDIAQSQVQAAELNRNEGQKQLQLAISAFLAGAALEDALRRLCDAASIYYDPQRASISKLQAALFQPSKQVEIISNSENKQITAWGDTRNKADHARFDEITQSEVIAMILGTRGFIDRHFPS